MEKKNTVDERDIGAITMQGVWIFSELSGECRRRIDNRLSNSNLNVSQHQEQLNVLALKCRHSAIMLTL